MILCFSIVIFFITRDCPTLLQRSLLGQQAGVTLWRAICCRLCNIHFALCVRCKCVPTALSWENEKFPTLNRGPKRKIIFFPIEFCLLIYEKTTEKHIVLQDMMQKNCIICFDSYFIYSINCNFLSEIFFSIELRLYGFI